MDFVLLYERHMILYYIWGAAYLGALFLGHRFLSERSCSQRAYRRWLGCIVALSVSAQVIIACVSPSHSSDLGSFSDWAVLLAQNGFRSYYGQVSPGIAYAPGWLPVFWLQGKLQLAFGWSSGAAYNLLYKMPGILLLALCSWALAHTARRMHPQKPSLALLIAAACAFCPALWADSALWGQLDLHLSVVLLLSLLSLMHHHPASGLLWFAFAILVKPQALAFIPVYAIYYLWLGVSALRSQDSHALASLGIGLGGSLLLFLFFSLLCQGPDMPFTWLFSYYLTATELYPLASLGAMNFYNLLGLSGHGNDSLIFGISAGTLSRLAMLAAVVVPLVVLWRRHMTPQHFVYAVCCAYLLAYTFMVSMHERYLTVILLPMLLLCLLEPCRPVLSATAAAIGVSFMSIMRALVSYWLSVNTDNNALSILCSAWIVWAALAFSRHGLSSCKVTQPEASAESPHPAS